MSRGRGRQSQGGARRKEGGAYFTSLSFSADLDNRFRAREEGFKTGQSSKGPSTYSQQQVLDNTNKEWKRATDWEPADSTDFALDPDSDWYNLECHRKVTTEDDPTPAPQINKKKRSKVSLRPHIVWKEIYRSAYLDEICRQAGRGDFTKVSVCPDCMSSQSKEPGKALYRCSSECVVPDLTCKSCCVRRHRKLPLHRIQMWNGDFFVEVSLKSLGLTLQLNHASMHCQVPVKCHQNMVVLHTNGFHEVTFEYCGCGKGEPQHIQLLRRQYYPANQLVIQTCATFELLDLLHKLSLTTKASIYDFYRGLDKLTNNTGLLPLKYRYRSLYRMALQWRHLKMLKWSGRAHDPGGPDATKPGGLGVLCPSCPYPGINIPDDWDKVPEDMRFLYMALLCMDANFRLKNQLVSNWSQDPGLGLGLAYMLHRTEYEAFVRSRTTDADVSSCVGFQAIVQANTRFSQGLRYTGVGAVLCGRSEMVLPQGVGNLHKGERYSNMDYIFGSAVQSFLTLSIVLISYDIACQWFVNLYSRMADHWPAKLVVPPTTKLIPAIPKLHEPMHEAKNHQAFSLNYVPGVGLSDLEAPERFWAPHNALANSTKGQGPGTRHDTIDDHFGFWNWMKYTGMGLTLARRYCEAVAHRNLQKEAHRGLTASLGTETLAEWEKMANTWDQDSFPKTVKNPYDADCDELSEAQAKRELAKDEEKRLKDGGAALHKTGPDGFITMGLEIEESQRRILRMAKNLGEHATASQEGGLTEQRNQLTTRIRAWEQLLPIYLPGLLQHQADQCHDSTVEDTEYPESHILWLPSQVPSSARLLVCLKDVPEIEEKMRTAQCAEALSSLRRTLILKSRLCKFKNKNMRGQREGTRSRAIIDRVHERARAAAIKYRAARTAKHKLSGPGGWETTFQIMLDADIRSYQDPNKLKKKKPRHGILEDSQLAVESIGPPTTKKADGEERSGDDSDSDDDDDNDFTMGDLTTTDSFSLLPEERKKRDGTGETRRMLSWIWLVSSNPTGSDKDNDEILRVEWTKSRARAARAVEEVLLLQEEMARVLKFLRWKSEWWRKQIGRRNLAGTLEEGLQAYAKIQADIQDKLAIHFLALWKDPLADALTAENGDEAEDEDEGHEDWETEDTN